VKLEFVIVGRPQPDRNQLRGFVILYMFLYAAFGAASPFWPLFFEERGIGPEQLGLMLGLGTAVRLMSSPVASGIADRLRARRAVLVICIGLSAAIALGFLWVGRFPFLLLVSVCHAAALAPVTVLADALGSRQAAAPGMPGRFEYGWVRGAGSAAFVGGTLMAGQFVSATGLSSIIALHAGLLAGAAFFAAVAIGPTIDRQDGAERVVAPFKDLAALLRIARFRRLLLVAALILGSHAMHDAFAVIRWHAGGIGPGVASALWSLSVAGEVVVFFLIGPGLVRRAGPAGAAAIAAGAGLLRWVVMALTAEPLALVLVQPLHGLTFALLHLACMGLLIEIVPPQLAATGQAAYALAAALASAVLTFAAGALYAHFDSAAFLAMAALCAVALPLTQSLRMPGQ